MDVEGKEGEEDENMQWGEWFQQAKEVLIILNTC